MKDITEDNKIVSVASTMKIKGCKCSCKCKGSWHNKWFISYWTVKGNGYRYGR